MPSDEETEGTMDLASENTDTSPAGAAPKLRRLPIEALPRLTQLLYQHNAKISKLNKRHGLNLQPITFRQVGETQQVFVPSSAPGATPFDTIPRYFAGIEIEGDRPVIAGWEIVSVLSLTDVGYLASKLTNSSLTDVAPFASRGGDCDHCHARRRRATTYVVKHASSGLLKVVGSSCVVDFTGHKSPGALLAYAEYLSGLESELDDLEEGSEKSYGGRRQYSAMPLVTFLGYVRRCIADHGWLSKGKAFEYGGTPTAQRAWDLTGFITRAKRDMDELLATTGMTGEELAGSVYAAKLDEIQEVLATGPMKKDEVQAQEDLDLVEETFSAAVADLTPGFGADDFQLNTLTVIRQGFAFGKNLGLAAAICNAADRIRDKAAKEKLKTEVCNEWFGEIKKRETFTVKVLHITEYESKFNTYGRRTDDNEFGQTAYIYLMADEQGRRCKWFTSSGGLDSTPGAVEKGRTFTVKATVKDHSEYKGIKETVLTRVKMVKEIV